MTVGQYVSFVRRILAGGRVPDSFRVGEREVQAALGMARDGRVKTTMFENGRMTEAGYVLFPDLLSVYFVPVVCDTRRNRFYSELPVAYVSGLPENKGLYRISFVKSEESAFPQVKASYVGDSFGLDSYAEIGTVFWPEGAKKIWWDKWEQTYPAEVMVKMVPRVEGLKSTDELPMPSDLALAVVQDVLKIYGVQMPTDKINDSINQPT